MKPLKKPFEASDQNIHISIEGKIYRCANLLKSGILNQSKILIAIYDSWHEVNVLNLGADNSDLNKFKTHIGLHNYSLSDFGISSTQNKKNIDYNLQHSDFMELQEKFPSFNYIEISHLNDYAMKSGMKSGKQWMIQTLKFLEKSKYSTIKEYIDSIELQKNEIINNNLKSIKMKKLQNETIQNKRMYELKELGFVFDEQKISYVFKWGTEISPASFEVSLESISEDSDMDWDDMMQRILMTVPSVEIVNFNIEAGMHISPPEITHEAIPVLATELESTKKPVSVAMIGNLSPARILEFQRIKEDQEQIVKDNPVVTITDAESLKKAEATAKILLKASTNIDASKTGILGTFVTHANQFIKMGKDFLEPIAKMTRDPYNKQKTLIDAYKSAEELRKQKEAREKLEKINKRTQSLFDVPMVFNGSQYVLGTLYILPSQIEKSTDEEFSVLLKQAQDLKIVQDTVASENLAKDAIIKDLQEKLALLTGSKESAKVAPIVTEPENVSRQTATTVQTTVSQTIPSTPSANSTPTQSPVKQKYIDMYLEADSQNTILLKLDLENVAHISNPNFIKCRAFYIRGILDTAAEIRKIFASESQTKAVDIRSFLDIIEKEKCYAE